MKFEKGKFEDAIKELREPFGALYENLEALTLEVSDIYKLLENFYDNYKGCLYKTTQNVDRCLCSECDFVDICNAKERLEAIKDIDYFAL